MLLNERVDNKARFLEAAAEALESLATAIDPKTDGEKIRARKRGHLHVEGSGFQTCGG
jgi:hypothetical protein